MSWLLVVPLLVILYCSSGSATYLQGKCPYLLPSQTLDVETVEYPKLIFGLPIQGRPGWLFHSFYLDSSTYYQLELFPIKNSTVNFGKRLHLTYPHNENSLTCLNPQLVDGGKSIRFNCISNHEVIGGSVETIRVLQSRDFLLVWACETVIGQPSFRD